MTDHDFNGERKRHPVRHRIHAVQDRNHSGFRRFVDRRTFVDSAIDGAIAIDEIGAMVYRDGRIASMLTHPALDRPVRRDLEFPSVAEAESR